MLTALILICSLAHSPDIRDCTRSNAVDIMVMPDASPNPATCFMHGQAYLAATDIGRNLSDNERVKVVCVRRETAEILGTAVAERPPLRER